VVEPRDLLARDELGGIVRIFIVAVDANPEISPLISVAVIVDVSS